MIATIVNLFCLGEMGFLHAPRRKGKSDIVIKIQEGASEKASDSSVQSTTAQRTAAGARIRTQYTTLSQIPNPMGPLTERARVRRTYAHKSKVTYRQGCRQEKNKVDFHKRRSHEELDKKCLCVLREGKRDLDQDLDVTSGILTGKLSSFRCPPVQNWTSDCVPRKNFR